MTARACGIRRAAPSFGDDEPVTVLAPPGADITDPAAPGVVTVSLTGYAGFEGGLGRAVAVSLLDAEGQPLPCA